MFTHMIGSRNIGQAGFSGHSQGSMVPVPDGVGSNQVRRDKLEVWDCRSDFSFTGREVLQ